MNAPCFCQCRGLNCVTLAAEYPDGSHDHFPWLPCLDQVKRPDGMLPDAATRWTARKERVLQLKRKRPYHRKRDLPLFQDHSAG